MDASPSACIHPLGQSNGLNITTNMRKLSAAQTAKAEARKAKRLMLAAAYKAKTQTEVLTCYLSIFDHQYSSRNSVLLKLQGCPPGRCGGYQQWRQVGRTVKKGEAGYDIMVPMRTKSVASQPETLNQEKNQTNQETLEVFFTWCAIFHENQTEALSLAPISQPAEIPANPSEFVFYPEPALA